MSGVNGVSSFFIGDIVRISDTEEGVVKGVATFRDSPTQLYIDYQDKAGCRKLEYWAESDCVPWTPGKREYTDRLNAIEEALESVTEEKPA